jgi:C4-type Zn-finger protein
MNEVMKPGDRVECPYCGDTFGLDETRISNGLQRSGGLPLIKVPCCSCGRMFDVKILDKAEEMGTEKSRGNRSISV